MVNIFLKSFNFYLDKNPEPLREFIKSVDIVENYQWQHLLTLITNKRFLNLDCGSSYLKGSIDILNDSLFKLNSKNIFNSDRIELSTQFLSEDTLLFKQFLNNVKILTDKKFKFSASFLKWKTEIPEDFWVTFHLVILDKLTDNTTLTGQELINTFLNINEILINDNQQKISSYIEEPIFSQDILIKIIEYSKNYNLTYIKKPKYKLDILGRTNEAIEQITMVCKYLSKMNLDKELNSNLISSYKKIKI